MECQCYTCQGACTTKPGWFKPGEAEEAAEFMGLALEEFFNRYLGVDWWEGDVEDTFVLAPAVTHMIAGEKYDEIPRGQCVFFQDGLCKIHPVKPFECRELKHETYDVIYNRHRHVAESWEQHQDQIEALLGQTE